MTSLQHHEHLFEFVNDSVMTRTMEGRINFWNRSAEELYGWRKEEAVGRVSHDLLQTQFPQPLEEIESELVRNGRWEGKLVHTTRDGGRVVVESRWTLDLKGQSGAVVEINARSADLDARTDSYGVESGRRKSLPANDLLPKIANIILAGGASLCILVLFYLIYSYGWTAERRFSTRFVMVLYFVFPAVLAGLLLAFLRRSREFKVNAAIACVSVAVSVYAVELTLAVSTSAFRPSVTLWGDVPPAHREEIVALAKKSGINFDVRSKFEVVRDLRQRGISAVPAAIPLELVTKQPDGAFKSKLAIQGAEILPLSGISNRITVLCNETGKYTIYDSDQRGFHNPKTIWESSTITIGALGDSFTMGACVPSDKNFVALIREHYPDTLNLGMLGEGPLAMLAALKEYFPFLKPKVVLWFFFEQNDFADLLQESKTPVLTNYLQADFNQDLFNRQGDIDQALSIHVEQGFKAESTKENKEKDTADVSETLESFLKLWHLRQKLELVYGRNQRAQASQQGEHGEYSEVQLNLFRNVLLQAKRSVNGWGGTLYFVYLPARDRYANKQNYQRESILAIVRNIDLPIIDIHDSFQSQSDPLSFFPFGRFGHYNEDGQRVVAEQVLRSIAPKGS